jgi:protein SCO1/2
MNSPRSFRPRRCLFALIAGAGLVLIGAPLAAETSSAPIQGSWLSQKDLATIGVDQRLGEQVPAGLKFTDSKGQPVDFDALLARKPTILALVYYNCPNLCTIVLNAMVLSLADLRRDVGDGFQVVAVSIDPSETPALAAQKKAVYLRRYARGTNQDQEWHFLLGKQADITKLAAAVGYRYRYDPTIHQFAHGSALIVLDPQRRVTKYFLGIEYPPAELDQAVLLAQKGGTGSPVQNFLLLCYCYNPLIGPYGFLIFTVMKIAAGLTVLAVAGFIFIQLRRDLKPKEAA